MNESPMDSVGPVTAAALSVAFEYAPIPVTTLIDLGEHGNPWCDGIAMAAALWVEEDGSLANHRWRCVKGNQAGERCMPLILQRALIFDPNRQLTMDRNASASEFDAVLQAAPWLRRLDLNGCQFVDETVVKDTIAELASLEELSLRCVPITSKAFTCLANRMPELRVLDLNGCSVFHGGRYANTECAAAVDAIETFTKVEKLNLTRCPDFATCGLGRFASMRSLQELVLCERSTRFSSDEFESIAELQQLKRLTITTVRHADEKLRTISRLQTLVGLHLTNDLMEYGNDDYELTSRGMEHLGVLVGLETLTLCLGRLRDRDLLPLSNLSKLKDVRLTSAAWYDPTRSGNVTEWPFINVFQTMQHLERLDWSPNAEASTIEPISVSSTAPLSGLKRLCWRSPETVAKHVVPMAPNLEKLMLKGPVEGREGYLASLQQLSRLKELDIENCRGMNQEALQHVAALISLQSLALRNAGNTLCDASVLAGLVKLRRLDLSTIIVKDEALAAICQGCRALETLEFSGEYASPRAAISVATLHSLTQLSITHFGPKSFGDNELSRLATALEGLHTVRFCNNVILTDDGLRALGSHPNLRSLDLSGCFKLTDHAFEILCDAERLENLRLMDCPLITANAANEFGYSCNVEF